MKARLLLVEILSRNDEIHKIFISEKGLKNLCEILLLGPVWKGTEIVI